LVTPLKDTWVTPNHLTTVRLAFGLAAAAAFLPGTYGWSNLGALLLIVSNFLDHTDGVVFFDLFDGFVAIAGRPENRSGHIAEPGMRLSRAA